MPEYYNVTVPNYIQPGDSFQVLVGGEVIKVRCPENATAGSKLEIKALTGSETVSYLEYQPPHDRVRRRYQDDWPSSRIWIFFDLLLFVLFTLSCTLPIFATQRLNTHCNAVNPNTNTTISHMFYNLYNGLGTTETCSTVDGELCLKWSDLSIWTQFASLSPDALSSGNFIQRSWITGQVLLPIAAFFTLVALGFHIAVMAPNYRVDQKVRFLVWGGNFITFAWIVGIFAINYMVGSAAMSEHAWASFYSNGYNLVNLLTENDSAGTPTSNCHVNVVLTDGGVALSIALPVAFFVSITILISTCCILMSSTSGTRSYPPYYSNVYRNRSVYSPPVSPVIQAGSVDTTGGSVSSYQVIYSDTGYASPPSRTAISASAVAGRSVSVEEQKDNIAERNRPHTTAYVVSAPAPSV